MGSINRTAYAALVDDDGSGNVGSIFNKNAIKTVILDPIDAVFAAALRCQAYNSAVQSIPSATFTLLTFDTEDYDVGSFHSTSVNTGRFTVPAGGDGLYLVNASTRVATMASGTVCTLAILKNGSIVKIANHPVTNATTQDFDTSAQFALVAGDYIEVQGYQDSSGAINFGGALGSTASRFSLCRLSA